jgi:hypothetical protein
MYYSAKVNIITVDNKGREKKQVEEYLVNAVSVTDAETKVHEQFKAASANTTIDFEVKSVSQTRIIEVLN